MDLETEKFEQMVADGHHPVPCPYEGLTWHDVLSLVDEALTDIEKETLLRSLPEPEFRRASVYVEAMGSGPGTWIEPISYKRYVKSHPPVNLNSPDKEGEESLPQYRRP